MQQGFPAEGNITGQARLIETRHFAQPIHHITTQDTEQARLRETRLFAQPTHNITIQCTEQARLRETRHFE